MFENLLRKLNANSLLRAFGYFDNYGLKHSLKHLKEIRHSIPFWNRHAQKHYAGQITVENIDTPMFQYSDFLSGIYTEDWMKTYNATTVGNLAYVSLYHKDKEIRERAEKMLYLLANYLRRTLPDAYEN